MTDNEIIKALEYCTNNKEVCDDECPCVQLNEPCVNEGAKLFGLIRRQQAEIEMLREINAGFALSLLHEVVNDDPDLRKEITAVAKAEAIRDFVKQHKEIMRGFLYNDSTDFMMKWCEYETNTDNLLKEMIGDKNER